MPISLGIYPDDGVGGGCGLFAVAGDAGDRNLDRYGADVGAAEAVDAERVDIVRVLPWSGKSREEATQIECIEHRAQIDVKRLGALPGEHADAGGGVSVNALRRQGGIVREGRRTGVGRYRNQLAVTEQLRPIAVADLGHAIDLAPGQSRRSGTIQRGDTL